MKLIIPLSLAATEYGAFIALAEYVADVYADSMTNGAKGVVMDLSPEEAAALRRLMVAVLAVDRQRSERVTLEPLPRDVLD